MNYYLKVLIGTTLVFGVFTFISYLSDDGRLGFPFWFYKEAFEISLNPETGEKSGTTSEIEKMNLQADIVISIIITYFILRIFKSRKQIV